jgi:hypothetical protein
MSTIPQHVGSGPSACYHAKSEIDCGVVARGSIKQLCSEGRLPVPTSIALAREPPWPVHVQSRVWVIAAWFLGLGREGNRDSKFRAGGASFAMQVNPTWPSTQPQEILTFASVGRQNVCCRVKTRVSRESVKAARAYPLNRDYHLPSLSLY